MELAKEWIGFSPCKGYLIQGYSAEGDLGRAVITQSLMCTIYMTIQLILYNRPVFESRVLMGFLFAFPVV